jgi:hypothetical protein
VEAVSRDGDDRRQVLLVDERDARLRARVAGDEPDEKRDHDRIREQRAEQERRAPQNAQILPEQEQDGRQRKTSSAAPA